MSNSRAITYIVNKYKLVYIYLLTIEEVLL